MLALFATTGRKIGITPEQQIFNEKKTELGKEVHKQALLWIQNASQILNPDDKFVEHPNIICFKKVNQKTKETIKYYIFKDKVLENTQVNYKEMIAGLSNSQRAAFNFFLNKNINDFNCESLEMFGTIIKTTENIEDLKDSAFLKVATLKFIVDHLFKDDLNSKMLEDKCVRWWS